MKCPKCDQKPKSPLVTSYKSPDVVYRRWLCGNCQLRFSSWDAGAGEVGAPPSGRKVRPVRSAPRRRRNRGQGILDAAWQKIWHEPITQKD